MEISFAFLTENYRCLEGCAFCCLCEPEIPAEELAAFLSDKILKEKIQRKFADGEYKYVIKLRNRHGACSFLSQKRCTIYEKRPLYCRLYPFQRHLSTRLQITANLSCRGLWESNGEDLRKVASQFLPDEKNMRAVAAELKKRYEETKEKMVDERVYISQEEVQKLVLKILPLFTTKEGLEKILSFADTNEFSTVAPSEIFDAEINVDAAKYATEISIDVFREKDVVNLPVYSTKDLEWFLLRFENGALQWYVMDEEGRLEPVRRVELKEEMMPLTGEAKQLLERYILLLNERDITYGNALLLTTSSDYEIPVLSNYLGALATSVLELWWRACLFASSKIDINALREGIIFYDADYLDKPTLGAVF